MKELYFGKDTRLRDIERNCIVWFDWQPFLIFSFVQLWGGKDGKVWCNLMMESSSSSWVAFLFWVCMRIVSDMHFVSRMSWVCFSAKKPGFPEPEPVGDWDHIYPVCTFLVSFGNEICRRFTEKWSLSIARLDCQEIFLGLIIVLRPSKCQQIYIHSAG